MSGDPFFAPGIHTAGTVKHWIHLEAEVYCLHTGSIADLLK